MWLLSFLPDYTPHALLLLGLVIAMAGAGIGYIPGVEEYKLPLKVIGIVILMFSLYIEGEVTERKEWEAKTKDLEIKLSKAEAASAKVNTEIVTKVLTQKQIIREKGETVTQYVHDTVVQYDNTCTVPEEAINAHNMAAINDKIDVKLLNDAAKLPAKAVAK